MGRQFIVAKGGAAVIDGGRPQPFQSIRVAKQPEVVEVLLSADQQEANRQALNALEKGDWVTVTYFQPVKSLDGQLLGEYTVISGAVKKVDDVERLLILEGCSIPFGNIHTLAVQGTEEVESA